MTTKTSRHNGFDALIRGDEWHRASDDRPPRARAIPNWLKEIEDAIRAAILQHPVKFFLLTAWTAFFCGLVVRG